MNEYSRKLDYINSLNALYGSDLISMIVEKTADEITLNPDGKVFVKFKGGLSEFYKDLSNSQAEVIIKKTLSLNLQNIEPDQSIIESTIKYVNARFTAVLPPSVKHPVFCIRILNCADLSLTDLKRQNFITRTDEDILTDMLNKGFNLLVCGQTGCGKTTFINALLSTLSTIAPQERIISIEDTPELCLKNENSVSLYTDHKNSYKKLLKTTLRLSPDRIVIGEIRSDEALDLINAMCTGHKGSLASIHSGTPLEALYRLQMLAGSDSVSPDDLKVMIGQSIDAVIMLKSSPYRHVHSITRVHGFNNNSYELEALTSQEKI